VPILADIEKQSANVAQDKNVGKYVWSADDEKTTSASSVSDRSLGYTPAVIHMQASLDQELQRIKGDVDHIFTIGTASANESASSSSSDQDVFSISRDSLALRNSLQRACVDAIFEFKGELEKMVFPFA
jgi:hypothetical protein